MHQQDQATTTLPIHSKVMMENSHNNSLDDDDRVGMDDDSSCIIVSTTTTTTTTTSNSNSNSLEDVVSSLAPPPAPSIVEEEEAQQEEEDFNALVNSSDERSRDNSLKEKFKYLINSMKCQFKSMFDIAFPIVLMNVSNKIIGIEDLIFIGHLGNSQYMAGSALGNAIFFSLSFIAVGVISGQDTFVAQAFGAKNKRLVGIWMMRSLFILLLFLMPVIVCFFFLESILNFVGMDPVTSHLSGQFVRYLLPGLIPFAICRSMARFLTSVNIRLPNTLIPIVAIFVNLVLNWIFVFGIGFKGIGFLGAAIATSLTRIFTLFCYIYVLYHHCESIRECLIGATRWNEVFQLSGFTLFLKQAIPGTIAICAEIWAFEFTTIVASFISPIQVAAHSVVFNIASLSFMIPLALGNTSSVMVGQNLGSNNPTRAKYAAYLCLSTSVLCMCVNGAIIGIFSKWIPLIYTTDQSVIDVASSILPLISLFAIVDGIQRTSSGILRGASSQFISMIINLVSYYLFSLPISSLLAFVAKLELFGLWLGLTMSIVFMAAFLLFYIIFRINWNREAQIASERARSKNVILSKTVDSQQDDKESTCNP